MRELIISEIKRLALSNGGTSPGVAAFKNATGITQAKWRGVYWARWSDALAEAGFTPNRMVSKLDSDSILLKVAHLCLSMGRMPTNSDMRLWTRKDPSFPNEKTVSKHFGNMAGLKAALRRFSETSEYSQLAAMIPEPEIALTETPYNEPSGGWVYLLKAGQHYKIGRSNQIETRLKRISVALPEATTLIHAIRTDDAPGIEAYWHRRFSDRRANGEWFRLTSDDVRAFGRRTFM